MPPFSALRGAALALALGAFMRISVGATGVPPTWVTAAANPILGLYRAPIAMDDRAPAIWNDPSVLVEDDGYSMWASMGRNGPHGVAIYKLRSRDGERWEVVNGGAPVLEPGRPGAFDSLGVESPAVVKVGETYHMYYSAFWHGRIPLVTMGHATSRDGIVWRKHGELTSLTSVVGAPAGNRWGWLARGEAAVVHHDGIFYLYFTDVRCRTADCGGNVAAIRGISVATSTDGHSFSQHGTAPVVVPSPSYPASEGWEGYSTPAVVVESGSFEMFCDVFQKVGADSIQTALTRWTSADGVTFTEREARVMSAGTEEWAEVSVRSPSVVVAGGVWRMWYAGDNYDPARQRARSGQLDAGIGLAILDATR